MYAAELYESTNSEVVFTLINMSPMYKYTKKSIYVHSFLSLKWSFSIILTVFFENWPHLDLVDFFVHLNWFCGSSLRTWRRKWQARILSSPFPCCIWYDDTWWWYARRQTHGIHVWKESRPSFRGRVGQVAASLICPELRTLDMCCRNRERIRLMIIIGLAMRHVPPVAGCNDIMEYQQ